MPYLTTRLQIRADLVSANRQAWINGLRDDLSELSELLTFLFLLRPGTFSGEEGNRFRMEKRSKVRLLINRVRLRLNPEEEPSTRILQAINQLRVTADAGANASEAEATFEQWMEAAIANAQEILKAEWKRVKKGK
jgi:hypothetical protein